MATHICANCGNSFEGDFCNACGQKVAHRYDVHHIFHELIHVFTHADKGIFSFARQVIVRPGEIALDLLAGKRKRYFNVFQYLIIIVGFVTFLMVKGDVMKLTMEDMNKTINSGISGELKELQGKVGFLLQKYSNIVQLSLIPFFALFSWWWLGKKRGYNFAEMVVLHAVSSAQTNTLSLVTTGLLIFFKSSAYFSAIMGVSLLVMVVCFAILYRQFFKFSWVKATLFGILVFFSVYILQSILSAIFMLAYLFLSA